MHRETAKGKCVVWAVDPFETEAQPDAAVVRELAETVRRAGLELAPVHVISVVERQWESGELPHVPELQAAVDRYLCHFGLEEIRARVIVEETGSRLGAVRALLDLADAEQAEWITVSSHGRSGVERLMLGSFAELLSELSSWPVLFLPRHPPRREASATRVALFPTDLSPAAHRAFGKFLDIASHQRFEIVLVHALAYPIPSMDFGFGPVALGPVLPETYVRDQSDWAKAQGARLVEEASRRGVKARFVLEDEIVPSITGETVLKAARRERARMIAMLNPGGAVTHLVAGGVAQEVFRTGRMLTWLYGPRAIGDAGRLAA